MTIKKPVPKDMIEKLNDACVKIESVIAQYENELADCGWDSFTDTLANVSAQVYMMQIMLKNAQVKESYYR